MKRLNYIALIAGVILFLSYFNTSQSQWLQSSGPYGANVRQLVFNASNDAFIATNGGVMYRSNISSTWEFVNAGLTTNDIRALAVSGINLYAAGFEVSGTPGGVFLSTNKGNSWTAINTGLTNKSLISLGVSGTFIYAGTAGAGMFFTSNNGANWISRNSGLSGNSLYINCYYASGSIMYAGTQEGLAKTDNNGQTWTVSISGLPNVDTRRVSAITQMGSVLYIGTGQGIFKSTDNGATFTNSTGDLPFITINSLNNDGTTLYAAAQNGGVFKTTNGGQNWTSMNSGLTNLIVNSINIIPNYVYVGSQGDGVFYSFNGGPFVKAVAGMYNTSIRSMTIVSGNIYAGTTINGVFKSTNGGNDWTNVNTGLSGSVNAMINDGSNIYAGTGTGVYKSANQGNTWTLIGNNFNGNNFVLSLLKNGNNIYAGTLGQGVWLSTNEGANWASFNNGLTNLNVWSLANDLTYLYCAAEAGGVYRTLANNSVPWSQVNNGISGSIDLRTIGVFNNEILSGYNGLWKSSDNGNNWTSISNGLMAGKTVRSVLGYGSITDSWGYIIGTTNGIFASTDGGNSYYNVNTGLPNLSDVYVICPQLNILNVFIGITGYGVWKRPVAEIISGINQLSTEVPVKYELSQNYPNPFNPVTKIKFALPKNSFTTLKVYDITGREVENLVNDNLKVGIYEYTFDASKLTSGIYIYKIQSGDFVSVKKMILVK